jgi:D-amino-acid dehydrogenase
VRANLPLNAECLDAYDELTANGVAAPTNAAPVTAGFTSRAQAAGLVHELERMRQAGQHVEFAEITGSEARQLSPQVSSTIAAAVRLEGQRYVDPGSFVQALARSVVVRGGTIRAGFPVQRLHSREAGGVTVTARHGESLDADAVVLATGAWLGDLARDAGVRVPVRAGRGYSFTVPTEDEVPGPIYLPTARVACTPYHGGLRVAGTMEFRGADAPLDRSRVEAIVASVRELLTGVAWDERTDVWVGPRPVSADGRPLIGATARPGVFVAGGHGMWGLAHGPITGRLLAERIATGKQPETLREFDPVR